MYERLKSGWAGMWVPILFVALVGGAVTAILVVRHQSDHVRHQLANLATVENAAFAQKTAVTDLLATGVIAKKQSPIFQAELRGAEASMEELSSAANDSLMQLVRDPILEDSELKEIYDGYESLVTVQARLLAENEFGQAWSLQRRSLDPEFRELQEVIGEARSMFETRAETAGRTASLGILSVFAVAIALVFLLWNVVGRQRARYEKILRHQALHDGLTSLANSSLFREEIDRALALAQRRATDVALVYCDLDDFKPINDTFGHHVGDAVLIETSERLRDCVRSGDLVARLGGDEFGILLQDIERPGDVEVIVDRISEAVSAPLRIDGHDVAVGVSLGVAFGREIEPEVTLLQLADGRMYEAKASRKAARSR